VLTADRDIIITERLQSEFITHSVLNTISRPFATSRQSTEVENSFRIKVSWQKKNCSLSRVLFVL